MNPWLKLPSRGNVAVLSRRWIFSALGVVSLAVWFFFPRIEPTLFYYAGIASLSPLFVKSVVHQAIILISFVHVAIVSFLISLIVLHRSAIWRIATAIFIGFIAAYVIASQTDSDTKRMDGYCIGLGARIFKNLDYDLLIKELQLQLEMPIDQMQNSTKAFKVLARVFDSERPRMLLLPVGSESPTGIQVLWRALGGAYGIHYGSSPFNPGRNLDYELKLTNSLWIVVRQE